jgi:hypothetical protein
MQLLCALTDWQTSEVKRGRAKGNSVTSRCVVAADNWSWIVGTQRGGKEDSNIVGESFHGNIRLLFSYLQESEDHDAEDAAGKIVAALEARVGVKVARKEGEPLAEYGRRIDLQLGTSYMREHPPKVLKTVFKATEEEESE